MVGLYVDQIQCKLQLYLLVITNMLQTIPVIIIITTTFLGELIM